MTFFSIETFEEDIDCSTVPQDENPQVTESESSSTAGNEENKDLDPKIRKGLERIKKLDNILCEKVKVIVQTFRDDLRTIAEDMMALVCVAVAFTHSQSGNLYEMKVVAISMTCTRACLARLI
jgi:hypothetical protein